jgi:predicted dehydrogenase
LECTRSPYDAFARVNPGIPPLMELYDEFAKAIERRPNGLPSFDDALATQKVLAAVGYDH